MEIERISQQRTGKRQFAINMLSGISEFVLNLCVAFFLTPFIVGKLGTAAYGYIGLSNNIIGYTGFLTIAVNSMAGRFIAIKDHEKAYGEANGYISTIFYSNLILSAVIFIAVIITTFFLPEFINIPDNMVRDVQALFILLGLSSVLRLITGVISIGSFIRNRLDIANTRNVIGCFIRVTLLLLLFGFLVPHLWYVGMTVIIMDIYVISSNYYFYRVLTPELHIRRKYFEFKYLKEVTAAGAWNIVSHLSTILSSGFDLLLANIFIGARAMGVLSITQIIPVMISGFFSMISGNFAPELTRLYAIKDYEGLKNELLRAVRLSGFLSCIPLSLLFAYGDIFYQLWLPTEDATLLYQLSCLGSLSLIFAIPQDPLWLIFTITNRLKKLSLNLLFYSIATFITVLLSMVLFHDNVTRLFVLASVRTFYGIIRVTTFLPDYGARCIGMDRLTFYPMILRNLLNIGIVAMVSIGFKIAVLDMTWVDLMLGCVFTVVVGIGASMIILLTDSDRKYILKCIKLQRYLS